MGHFFDFFKHYCFYPVGPMTSLMIISTVIIGKELYLLPSNKQLTDWDGHDVGPIGLRPSDLYESVVNFIDFVSPLWWIDRFEQRSTIDE